MLMIIVESLYLFLKILSKYIFFIYLYPKYILPFFKIRQFKTEFNQKILYLFSGVFLIVMLIKIIIIRIFLGKNIHCFTKFHFYLKKEKQQNYYRKQCSEDFFSLK